MPRTEVSLERVKMPLLTVIVPSAFESAENTMAGPSTKGGFSPPPGLEDFSTTEKAISAGTPPSLVCAEILV